MLKELKYENLEKEDIYKEAEKYSESFEPQKNKKYRWVYEHALDQFNDVSQSIGNLDKKADSMIKYLAPGTGLLSIALAFIVSQTVLQFEVGISILYGIVIIVIAMILSASALMPQSECMKPSIIDAIETEEYYSDEEHAQALFAVGINKSIQMKRIINEFKANRIAWSYKFFVSAVVWLLLATPLIYIIAEL